MGLLGVLGAKLKGIVRRDRMYEVRRMPTAAERRTLMERESLADLLADGDRAARLGRPDMRVKELEAK